MCRKYAEFNICPVTYILPQAFKRWEQERKLGGYKDVFIMKPNHLSCAKGIKIVGKKDEIKNKHNFILQKYLSSPHLLRGFKYDLRIYILVTSFDPLVAYMYQDGLVRMAT